MQPNSSSKTWVCFFLFNANPMSQCWRTVSMFLWLGCDSWCSLTNKEGTRCQIETSFNSLLCQYELIHFSTRQKTVSWSVLPPSPHVYHPQPSPPHFIPLLQYLPQTVNTVYTQDFLFSLSCLKLNIMLCFFVFVFCISCSPTKPQKSTGLAPNWDRAAANGYFKSQSADYFLN